MTVRVYEQQPIARMKLLAEVLATLELDQSGKLATITITREMVTRTGTHLDLTDGFINYARSVDGVEVAASFSEPVDGTRSWHVSFRSRGNVDVSRIAKKFGGGHVGPLVGDEAGREARLREGDDGPRLQHAGGHGGG